MFREIKEELRKGPTSIEVLSGKFGVSRERMDDAFRLLLNLGVIEEVSLSDCEAEKSLFCAFCPFAKSCEKSRIKMYRLKPTEPLPKTA